MLDILSSNAIFLFAERCPKAEEMPCPKTAPPTVDPIVPAVVAAAVVAAAEPPIPNADPIPPIKADKKGCMSDKRSINAIGLYIYVNIRIRSGQLVQGRSRLA